MSAREIPVLTGVNGTLMAWRSWPEPGRWPVRPSAFQVGHIPNWCGSSAVRCALSSVAAGSRWLLLLLSPLLSTRRRPSSGKPTRTVQGMARVRSGQAPAWPLVTDRSARRGSGVKRDFACTFTRRFSPCARCPAVTVALDAGGAGTYTTRAILGPGPGQRPIRPRNFLARGHEATVTEARSCTCMCRRKHGPATWRCSERRSALRVVNR